MEVNRRTQQLHVLHNWAATVTLITHEAADRTGQQPIWQQTKSMSWLNEFKIASTCFYMVPLLDCADDMQIVTAFGVIRFAWMNKGTLLPEIEMRFPGLKGKAVNLQQDEGHVDLLLGLDSSRWLPSHVDNSQLPFDNLRLMMSWFGGRYIMMGSPGKKNGASPNSEPKNS
jgi:hypothetical protein